MKTGVYESPFVMSSRQLIINYRGERITTMQIANVQKWQLEQLLARMSTNPMLEQVNIKKTYDNLLRDLRSFSDFSKYLRVQINSEKHLCTEKRLIALADFDKSWSFLKEKCVEFHQYI